MKYLILPIVFLLAACGGDNEVTPTSSDEVTFDTAPTSFTSKPNDEQLLALLRDGIRYDIKLGKGNGWNTTHQLRKRWHKNYNYKVEGGLDEYPDAVELIYGEFRFQINGTNYDIDTIRTVDREFLGIPLPSIDAMQKLLAVDLSRVFRKTGVIGEVIGPNIVENKDERKLVWHSAKSFSINVDVTYSDRSGDQLKTNKCIIHTRFSRESNTVEFVRVFGASPQCNVISSKPYVAPKIIDNSAKEFELAEKLAQAAFGNLVEIEIPPFKNEKEAIRFVYQTLHTGNKATIQALMGNMFADQFFVKGSKVQLSKSGREVFDNILNKVFAKDVNFQNSYCPQLLSRMTTKNYVILVDALNKNNFSISVGHTGGKMNRGKLEGGHFKITGLDLAIVTNQRDIENLKSWPLDELCAKTEKYLEIY